MFRIVNEQTRRPAENPVARVLKEGRAVGLANHTVLIARDGTERPIDDSAAPIQDESGARAGAVLVFRDVTARRRAEELLRRQEAELRDFVTANQELGIRNAARNRDRFATETGGTETGVTEMGVAGEERMDDVYAVTNSYKLRDY